MRQTPDNRDNRDRVAKIRVDMRKLRLAPLQRQRFQFLMGSRWNSQKPHFCKLVMRQYNTFSENYVRAFEIFREIYWESKRAPTIMHTMIVNPYRREKLIKKFFGKTAEERRDMRAKLRKANKEYQAHIDNKTM